MPPGNLEIRAKGSPGAVDPSSISFEQLSKLITLVHEALKGATNEAIDTPRIVQVRSSSATYGLSVQQEAITALLYIREAYRGEKFSLIPTSTLRPLRGIRDWARLIGADSVSIRSGKSKIIVKKDVEFPIPNISSWKESGHTVFGFLRLLGGENPRAEIVRNSGEVVRALITEGQLQDLKPSLRQFIGVEGTLTVTTNDSNEEEEKFVVDEIIPYREAKLSEVSEAVSSLTAGYDIERVRALREEDRD